MTLKTYAWRGMAAAALLAGDIARAAPSETELHAAVTAYFGDLFRRLETVAAAAPTEQTFRAQMKPQVETVDGFFGGSLISADWEIRQVYFRRDFLAVGYDLKNVRELEGFRRKMAEQPGPQLSEPARGTFWQPHLISLRCPVIRDGQMVGMVSMMVRTTAFLKAVGLDTCRAYRIVCLGTEAEHSGTLSAKHREVRVALPATEWVIQYE